MSHGRYERHEYICGHCLKMKRDTVYQQCNEHIGGKSPLDSTEVHEKGTNWKLDQHGGEGGKTLQLGGRVFVSGMRYQQFGDNILKTLAQIGAQCSCGETSDVLQITSEGK